MKRCRNFVIGLSTAIILIFALASPQLAFAEATDFTKTVQPFLKTYCVKCHGAKKPKGERRFDVLAGQIADDNELIDLQDILDQLNLGEMPPSDELQPSDDERREVIRWLTDAIADYHQTHEAATGETVLRRLNAREYRNTVRDLLKIETLMFDPTHGFPQDQRTENLDNVGDVLITSGHLLQRYLSAAEKCVDKALTPIARPDVQTWKFRDGFRQQKEIDQVHTKTNNFKWMTLYEVRGADKHEGAYGAIREFIDGVPVDGVYEIRFEAEALNRQHPYGRDFLGTDPAEPLRLGIVPGDRRVGELHHTQPIEPLLTEIDIADDRQWYTTQVWLDRGKTPRFTFENGSMDVRNLWTKVHKKYPDMHPKLRRGGIVEARFVAIKHGKFPQIRIHEFEIRGPLYEQWPTESHRTVLGDDWRKVAESGEFSADILRKHLTAFLSRAYRRTALPEEITRIVALIEARKQSGRSAIDAYGDGLKTALCSPAFLYLDQSADEDGLLSAHALASRLSYFLWGSMPDERLFELAAFDPLLKPDVLAAEVERLLDDPKSEGFLDGFLDSWLTLRNLGSQPPDRSTFPDYYHYDLNTAMREETRLFVRHLMEENLSVANFLDSDFTFVNRALARHYDLPMLADRGFQKVSLSNKRRGGLFGQASVLTVTANGIDTSPVVRGVWLLENILGTPSSPPPDDVEPLDPDIRGAKTIRDQLKKHRSVASCNDCHRKIDPMGFALENFDPVGRWRTTYGNRSKIDASGELPSGESFRDVEQLKSILVTRKEQFVRALTEKLLAYATGRHLTAADRPAVDAIVQELAARGNCFRDLLQLVVASEAFRSK